MQTHLAWKNKQKPGRTYVFDTNCSVVKSFESEDATILPKSATKGATPEIYKKAPSKIFDDGFF